MISIVGDNMATTLFPNLQLGRRARKAIQDAKENTALTGPQRFKIALDAFVTAVDESHEYPKSMGFAGKALEAGDGPIIRWILGAILQEAFDDERLAGKI